MILKIQISLEDERMVCAKTMCTQVLRELLGTPAVNHRVEQRV